MSILKDSSINTFSHLLTSKQQILVKTMIPALAKIPFVNVFLMFLSYPLIRDMSIHKLYLLVVLHLMCIYCQVWTAKLVTWFNGQLCKAIDKLESMLEEEKTEEKESADKEEDSDDDFVKFDECELWQT